MRIFLIPFLLIFSNSVVADVLCQYGDRSSLIFTWNSFRHSSINDAPEVVSKFYFFPVKLYSPTDSHGRDEKPIVLTKKTFLKNYVSIFRINPLDDEEVILFKELKNATGEYRTPMGFDGFGCSYQGLAKIGDYRFVWSKNNTWLIESVSYIGYADLIERFKRNEILK
jgi:hypothetical protein